MVLLTTDDVTSSASAALSLMDSLTHIQVDGLEDDVYQAVEKYFSEEEVAQLIMFISIINAWNRIGVSTMNN